MTAALVVVGVSLVIIPLITAVFTACGAVGFAQNVMRPLRTDTGATSLAFEPYPGFR